MMFFNAVQNRWKVWKADVKSAFLQGKAFRDEEKRYALRPKELARALGMDEKDPKPIRLEKAGSLWFDTSTIGLVSAN
jgi:hypothetical protein